MISKWHQRQFPLTSLCNTERGLGRAGARDVEGVGLGQLVASTMASWVHDVLD